MTKKNELASSFRDPSGSVFEENGKIFRTVNHPYKNNYDLLISSGLYAKLVAEKLLIPHAEIPSKKMDSNAYKIISPVQIPFISYPYEWCFGQLKDAALLTLKIQKVAVEFGMTLKDANSFNIQFLEGKPILIDTLSFEKYVEGEPWIAYKQFCEQFLAPLAIFSLTDVRLNGLLQTGLGSIPLDLAARLLPKTAWLNTTLLLHIFLHANSQKKFASTKVSKQTKQSFTKQSLLGLIDNLETGIKNLKWDGGKTTWGNYYEQNNYNNESFRKKGELTKTYLKLSSPKKVWDLGANTGKFSRIASSLRIETLSMDIDPVAVEQNYNEMKLNKEKNLLPLWIDITNPTPAIGWDNEERLSLKSRPHPDTIMALALVHHLAIGNNLPLSKIAKFFSEMCEFLIIEFIPKEDSQVKILLQNREDIFPNYTLDGFEKEFSQYFKIVKKTMIPSSKRTLYLFTIKS